MVGIGITSVKVIPLGGEKFFLKVDETEDFKCLMKESAAFFQEEFSRVREWEPRDVGGVRVFGVPVHAWRKKTFSALSHSFGRLIKLDQATEDMTRLDVARIFIRTPILEAINKITILQIKKREHYRVRITEEACDCYTEYDTHDLEFEST